MENDRKYRYGRILVVLGLLFLSGPSSADTGLLATYLAPHLQGERTALGVAFNHNEHWAAHPRLPLGTKVQVTNKENGKSVIVSIVSRCRCGIDLSQGAFRKIGLLQKGRIPVRLKILD